MQAFKKCNSRIIPLAMNDVDTDMIIPAQYLTSVDSNGYGKHLFSRLKAQDADFVFNNPKYQAMEILITKANFGCGSSREHAVWALQQSGIKVIIAESYSDIFFNNAAKNGLLLIQMTQDEITQLFNQVNQDDVEVCVDLQYQTITTSKGDVFNFDYDCFRKSCLLTGKDDLDYLLEATNA